MKTLKIAAIAVLSFSVANSVFAANPAVTLSEAQIASKIAEMQKQAELSAKTEYHAPVAVNTLGMRTEAQIEDVMKMNGISREDAIKRIDRSNFSQSGKMAKPIIKIFAAYDPSENAFRQPLQRNFYAGFDLVSEHEIFTFDKKLEVGDNYWYCGEGIVLVYSPNGSTCAK